MLSRFQDMVKLLSLTRFSAGMATSMLPLLLSIAAASADNAATAMMTDDTVTETEGFDASVERMARIIGGRRAPDTYIRAVCHIALKPKGSDPISVFSGFLFHFRQQRRLGVLTVAHSIVVNTSINHSVQTQEQANHWFGAHINEDHSTHYNLFRRGILHISCGGEMAHPHIVSMDAERYKIHIRLHKRFRGTAGKNEPIDDVAIILFADEARREAERLIKEGKWAFWDNFLPPGPIHNDQRCIMSGFGALNRKVVQSTYPREGVGKVMSARDCGREAGTYGGSPRPFGEPYLFLCLRAISGNPYDNQLLAAFGDSGGPVLCPFGHPPRYFLIGLIHAAAPWMEDDQVGHTIVTPLYERELWKEFLGPALQ